MSEIHDHDRGLSHDLPIIVQRGLGRRSVLALFGGVSAVALAGCGTDGTSTTSTGSTAGTGAGPGGPPPDGGGGGTTVSVAEGEIPEETAGPFPADGSNGLDVLSESGIVRSDVTSSFGSASGTAEGVALTIRMKVYDLNGQDATVLFGAAVYLWHCNRAGEYSMYSDAVKDQNYLRGVQATDAKGYVEFTSMDDATSASNKLRTSQMALPEEVCKQVYETDGYDASVANLSQSSLSSDNVFSDGYSLQMAKVTGSNAEGYVATLNVPV
jgi:hypothetical protein